MARDTQPALAENGDEVRAVPGEPLGETGPDAPSPRSVAATGVACTLVGGMLLSLIHI